MFKLVFTEYLYWKMLSRMSEFDLELLLWHQLASAHSFRFVQLQNDVSEPHSTSSNLQSLHYHIQALRAECRAYRAAGPRMSNWGIRWTLSSCSWALYTRRTWFQNSSANATFRHRLAEDTNQQNKTKQRTCVIQPNSLQVCARIPLNCSVLFKLCSDKLCISFCWIESWRSWAGRSP
jgi:hypothetical protein